MGSYVYGVRMQFPHVTSQPLVQDDVAASSSQDVRSVANEIYNKRVYFLLGTLCLVNQRKGTVLVSIIHRTYLKNVMLLKTFLRNLFLLNYV